MKNEFNPRRMAGWGNRLTRWWVTWALMVGAAAVAAVHHINAASGGNAPRPAPRGQPIRPSPARTAGVETNTRIVTLPGGVVITNLPASVLPSSPTNVVRLPTAAARRFEPFGYTPTSFTVLARFFPEVPTAGTVEARWEELKQQVPRDVLDLDGKQVAITGFMLPLSLENGRTKQFLLLRTQSACCFGMVPRVNELILVGMSSGDGVVPKPDTPIIVGGKLRLKWVGGGGQLTTIYEIEGDRVERVDG
jgi:hypothetical protein